MITNADAEIGFGRGGALDAAFIRAEAWRLPVEEVHELLRDHGSTRPDLAMKNYIDEGHWFRHDKGAGDYVATDKLKDLVAKRFLRARDAERA